MATLVAVISNHPRAKKKEGCRFPATAIAVTLLFFNPAVDAADGVRRDECD
jgi:hypothetical protein